MIHPEEPLVKREPQGVARETGRCRSQQPHAGKSRSPEKRARTPDRSGRRGEKKQSPGWRTGGRRWQFLTPSWKNRKMMRRMTCCQKLAKDQGEKGGGQEEGGRHRRKRGDVQTQERA